MKIKSPPNLDIPSLSLRQIERTDIPRWYDYLRLKEVYEHTSWDLQSEDDLHPLFLGYESEMVSSARRLAIIEKSTDTLVGTIGFHSISEKDKTAEITYDLAPQYWGKSIATSAINALTSWSFSEYGFVRVQATTLESNERSQHALQRANYVHEGLLRAYRSVRGRPGNFNIFSRLASENLHTPLKLPTK